MMQKIKTIIRFPMDIWLMFVTYLPGRSGYKLRYRYWKKRLEYLGKNVRIEIGVHFQNPEYIEINDDSWIDRNVIIMAGPDNSKREKIVRKNDNYPGKPGHVYIGKNCHITNNSIISGVSAGIYMGNDGGIAAGGKIYSFSNHYRSKKEPSNEKFSLSAASSHDKQCMLEGPIFIGNNSPMAMNVVVLPGVTIPDNCFVAIGSVLTGGEFPENSIIAGNPAKAIRPRFIRDESEKD
ncbi:MAG: acyltransferase [bacterium]